MINGVRYSCRGLSLETKVRLGETPSQLHLKVPCKSTYGLAGSKTERWTKAMLSIYRYVKGPGKVDDVWTVLRVWNNLSWCF